jgi:hypothetical protein
MFDRRWKSRTGHAAENPGHWPSERRERAKPGRRCSKGRIQHADVHYVSLWHGCKTNLLCLIRRTAICGVAKLLQCCEPTVEERRAVNPHAGSRQRATASRDPGSRDAPIPCVFHTAARCCQRANKSLMSSRTDWKYRIVLPMFAGPSPPDRDRLAPPPMRCFKSEFRLG